MDNTVIYAIIGKTDCEDDTHYECPGYFTTLDEARKYLDILEAENPFDFLLSEYAIVSASNINGIVKESEFCTEYFFKVLVRRNIIDKDDLYVAILASEVPKRNRVYLIYSVTERVISERLIPLRLSVHASREYRASVLA